MKTEFKDKWIEALNSDEFKQGTNVMYNAENNTHCCLGVLCEVASVDKTIEEHNYGPGMRKMGVYKLGTDTSVSTLNLSKELRDFLDISYEESGTLAGMNDEGKSFKEIATYIKEKL